MEEIIEEIKTALKENLKNGLSEKYKRANIEMKEETDTVSGAVTTTFVYVTTKLEFCKISVRWIFSDNIVVMEIGGNLTESDFRNNVQEKNLEGLVRHALFKSEIYTKYKDSLKIIVHELKTC